MSDLINDGQVQFGSRDLVIGGVTYATDDFEWTNGPGVSFDRTDKKSKLTGSVTTRGKKTGTATCQLASDATADPAWGAQFTTTEGICSITSVGRRESKGGETKVPISFYLNITGSVSVT